MPPPPRSPTNLGKVINRQGSFRAEAFARDLGSAKHIQGPRRGSQKRALEDLSIIHAAAAEHTTRMGALQAMQQAAARLKVSAVAEAGGVVAVDGEYRARIQYADNAGLPKEIKAPRRYDARRAQADLERIRAAGAGQTTREMGFGSHGQ